MEQFLDQQQENEIENDSLEDLVLQEQGVSAIIRDEEPRAITTIPKRLKSLSDCENPDNFDFVDVPETFQQEYYVAEWDRKNKWTVWQRYPEKCQVFNHQGRRPRQDVMTSEPLTVKPQYAVKTNIYDCFEIFFPKHIRSIIVEKTNQKISTARRRIAQRRPELLATYRTTIKDLDDHELMAVIGLMYARGEENKTKKDVSSLWNSATGLPIYGATMCRNRFSFLMRSLCFDEIATREERKKHDKFAPFRDVFKSVVNIFPTVMTSDRYNTIDETLYPSRGRFSFKKYISNKPSKYGINFQNLNAVTVPYIFASRVYAGKPINQPYLHHTSGKYFSINLNEATTTILKK